MAKQAKAKKEKSVEETLWESAVKLRGTVEPSEYKHDLLSDLALYVLDRLHRLAYRLWILVVGYRLLEIPFRVYYVYCHMNYIGALLLCFISQAL